MVKKSIFCIISSFWTFCHYVFFGTRFGPGSGLASAPGPYGGSQPWLGQMGRGHTSVSRARRNGGGLATGLPVPPPQNTIAASATGTVVCPLLCPCAGGLSSSQPRRFKPGWTLSQPKWPIERDVQPDTSSISGLRKIYRHSTHRPAEDCCQRLPAGWPPRGKEGSGLKDSLVRSTHKMGREDFCLRNDGPSQATPGVAP